MNLKRANEEVQEVVDIKICTFIHFPFVEDTNYAFHTEITIKKFKGTDKEL